MPPLPTSAFHALDLGLPTTAPFTRHMATEAGVSSPRLSRLLRGGVIRRLVEGVYVAVEVPDSIELRSSALALVVPDDAFICDRTAAWLYTGPRALGPNEHLAVPLLSWFRPSGRRALRGKLSRSGERAVSGHDLCVVGGLSVTTPLRTALDLGRLESTRDMRLWGMDNMLSTGAFTLDDLLGEVPRFRGERGVIGLRAYSPLVDGGAESFGESATRLRWYDAGLPRPQLQIPVFDGDHEAARIDIGLEDWLFGVEYDGVAGHSTEEQRRHDRDRRRWLSEAHRWEITVLRKAQVFGREQNADALIRKAAAEARASLARRTFII
jgi:hypothetical protein